MSRTVAGQQHQWNSIITQVSTTQLKFQAQNVAGFMSSLWKPELYAHNYTLDMSHKIILRYNKKRQMLQTDPFIVAAGWCGRKDRMCWGEAWAFVATQPTGPEPWPLTLHPGGQTKLWVTSETRHCVGRECLDRTQITPLTLQKRFMAMCSPLANFESRRVTQICQK